MAKKKDEKTNVMRILDQKEIPYTAHFYEGTDPNNTSTYGVHVAETLGQNPECTLKTLVARSASGAVYVFEVPVAENLDLKKAARSVGEKNVELLPVKEITGVLVLPVTVRAAALAVAVSPSSSVISTLTTQEPASVRVKETVGSVVD